MLNIKSLTYPFTILLIWFSSFSSASTQDHEYRIIVDANSTKTSLYLYQYDYNNALPYNLKIILKSHAEPGIDSIDNDDIDAYLNSIFHDELAFTLDSLTGDDSKRAGASILNGIQFYSTGGMRALDKTDQIEKNRVIKKWVDDWLISHFANPEKTNVDIRTLPGEEEAAYEWVAANYLETFFNGELSGVATINGASTQIAYPNTKSANVMVQVANKQYAITGRSFPLGQNVISEKLSSEDGCYLRGYKFSATGNYVRCRVAAKAMINNLIDNSVDYADKISDFRLYANFYYSAKFLDIEQNYSLLTLQKAAENYCSTPWEDAKEDHPDVNKNYLALYCMGAAFQGALLEDTYFLSNTNQTFIPESSISNFKVTWPIGALASQNFQLLNH